MVRKYDASSISVVYDDLDRVRKRPTTYIPSKGVEGAMHIPFEIIDNSIDEVTAKGSVGSTVITEFDTKTRVFTVTDDGSGIPQEMLLQVCTVINSSGKFDNGEDTAYQFSGGTNGIGLKLAVFLSNWCEVTSIRDGKSLTYKFKEGKLVDTIEEKAKGHGTIVKFRISREFANIDDLNVDDLKDRYKEKSYTFPTVKMVLILKDNGKVIKERTYQGKTIVDRVAQWKPDTEIIRVEDTRKELILEDITDDELTRKKVIVDLAFAFKEAVLDSADPMEYMISYGNTIKTYTGGSHVDGLKDGIVKFYRKNIIPKLKGKDKELPIMPSDMTAGLCGFVIAKVYNPEFRGQYKDQLSNPEVKYAVRDAVCEALENQKSSVINAMVEFTKRVTRGRMASKKTRKKDVSNAFSKDRLDKFTDIIQNLNTVSPELILLEGDSAADNAAIARDPNNQAIYPIKRPKNIFDMDSDTADKVKSTFNDVLDICGIAAGKKCDPSQSIMDRILLLTDGDVDGDDIAISTVCLFAKHCRPMIDAGMIGRILPPAYSIPIGNGKREYVRSQREFFDKILKHFIKNEEIGFKGSVMSKKDLRAFIEKNFEYDTRLEKLANRYCCDPKVMEYIAWCYHGHQKDQKKSYWMDKMKKYDGIKILIEDGSLVIDGDIPGSDYMNLGFDEYFDRHVHRFKDYQKINDDIYGYTINGEDGKTLYDVMHTMRKYIPKGVERFKGLGELDPDEMKTLCMDPETRTVVIFKFKKDTDMDKINIIMSTKKEFAEARSELLMSLRADSIDIDT